MKKGNNSVFVKNTVMLYILSFSNYFFGFITTPYLSRILGPINYGKIGLGNSFAVYLTMLLDFGFILSQTAKIAYVRNDKRAISKIFFETLFCKFILIGLSFFLLWISGILIPFVESNIFIFGLYSIYVSINALIPDYLYRGLERMEVVTLRTVIIKLIFTGCIFFFVKDDSQYYLVPIFYAVGALVAFAFIYIDLKKNIGICRMHVRLGDIVGTFKNSFGFFLSRIASTTYSVANTFVIGAVFPNSEVLGFYTASDRLITAGRSAITPISDSLYPKMIKEKEYALAMRIIVLGEAILIPVCIVCFIFAKPICFLVFGEEYDGSVIILKLMLPLLILTLPNYIIAFPVLTPLGMKKYANLSVIIGAIVHLTVLVVMCLMDKISAVSICLLTIVTETIVLTIRIIAMLIGFTHNRKGMI